jgi:hypothetical protein
MASHFWSTSSKVPSLPKHSHALGSKMLCLSPYTKMMELAACVQSLGVLVSDDQFNRQGDTSSFDSD